jgi:hypothetical protein
VFNIAKAIWRRARETESGRLGFEQSEIPFDETLQKIRESRKRFYSLDVERDREPEHVELEPSSMH